VANGYIVVDRSIDKLIGFHETMPEAARQKKKLKKCSSEDGLRKRKEIMKETSVQALLVRQVTALVQATADIVCTEGENVLAIEARSLRSHSDQLHGKTEALQCRLG